jgi:multiple sugar transport system permease protein
MRVKYPHFSTSTVLLLPVSAYLLLMTIYPTVYLIYLSLLNWTLPGEPKFVGLANYLQVIFAPDFHYSVLLTFGFGALTTGINLVLGLGAALLLREEQMAPKVVRMLVIIPLMMAPILVAMAWRYLYHPLLGPFNYMVSFLGIPEQDWVGSRSLVIPSLVLVQTWQYAPFMILLLLSGLSALPTDVLEAAEIDGAGRLASVRYVTVPLLRPVILIGVLFTFIDAIKVFNKIYILTGGGPGSMTDTLSWHIYFNGMGANFRIGYGATYSVLFLIMALALTALFVLGVRRLERRT